MIVFFMRKNLFLVLVGCPPWLSFGLYGQRWNSILLCMKKRWEEKVNSSRFFRWLINFNEYTLQSNLSLVGFACVPMCLRYDWSSVAFSELNCSRDAFSATVTVNSHNRIISSPSQRVNIEINVCYQMPSKDIPSIFLSHADKTIDFSFLTIFFSSLALKPSLLMQPNTHAFCCCCIQRKLP